MVSVEGKASSTWGEPRLYRDLVVVPTDQRETDCYGLLMCQRNRVIWSVSGEPSSYHVLLSKSKHNICIHFENNMCTVVLLYSSTFTVHTWITHELNVHLRNQILGSIIKKAIFLCHRVKQFCENLCIYGRKVNLKNLKIQ